MAAPTIIRCMHRVTLTEIGKSGDPLIIQGSRFIPDTVIENMDVGRYDTTTYTMSPESSTTQTHTVASPVQVHLVVDTRDVEAGELRVTVDEVQIYQGLGDVENMVIDVTTDVVIERIIPSDRVVDQNKTLDYSPSDSISSCLRDDGTQLFLSTSNGPVETYDLTTPWNVSTAVLNSSDDLGNTYSRLICFSADGGLFFRSRTDTGLLRVYIDKWVLTTPWDLSTASFVDTSTILSIHNHRNGGGFNPDGTRFYLGDMVQDGPYTTIRIAQYDLSTAYDVSSGTHSGVSIALGQGSASFSITQSGLYVYAPTSSTLQRYKATTAWDMTTLAVEEPSDLQYPYTDNADYVLTRSEHEVYIQRNPQSNITAYLVDVPLIGTSYTRVSEIEGPTIMNMESETTITNNGGQP